MRKVDGASRGRRRKRDRAGIEFGIAKKEIDKVWKRIQELKEQVDDSSLPVF